MIDHKFTEEIVCPWCGNVYYYSYEFKDDYGEIECDDCGRSFRYDRIISVEYSTHRVKCADKGCFMSLKKDTPMRNPYIFKNQNWTIWECLVCDAKIIKVNPYAGNVPKIELPVIGDFDHVIDF